MTDKRDPVSVQQRVFEDIYADHTRWAFHDTTDPLVRYVRDRRIRLGVHRVMQLTNATPAAWSALVVCGGVGGEGSLLANIGFQSVTVADFSENALAYCRQRDPRLQTLRLDTERMELPDAAYDLVLVQDGLHHLPRPVQGFAEMLRVAKRAVLVNEPHWGLVARLIGTTWENHAGQVNYVFRWNQMLLEQATRSLLLQQPCQVEAIRLWDHAGAMHRMVGRIPWPRQQLRCAKFGYFVLNLFFRRLGNAMVGVVVKNPVRVSQ